MCVTCLERNRENEREKSVCMREESRRVLSQRTPSETVCVGEHGREGVGERARACVRAREKARERSLRERQSENRVAKDTRRNCVCMSSYGNDGRGGGGRQIFIHV